MNSSVFERIHLIKGDITTLATDAIVNAANNSLLGGGGVDGAIHAKAGPELLNECKTLGGCPTGEAKITKGYLLPAKHVIHTVGPIYSGKPEDEPLLRSCYDKCFSLAMENALKTIAFPAISCGVYGYPITEATKIATHSCINFLKAQPGFKAVYFVLFSDETHQEYKKIIKQISV